ncbi:hypothetical protein [Rhizobium rhizogenes]|uniref:hypothetical protein n=1 Tax=Rhizobium rhizogenes TaxID=359 RepID=UPI001574E790|nr:hypothetical protein [Rhizobium rhizogenes]NTI33393.1 hypothetical protein [Rhizobium rhizogenes]WEO65092.1 hypothetical protein G6L54_018985 [Rhizobium rhizogenes]
MTVALFPRLDRIAVDACLASTAGLMRTVEFGLGSTYFPVETTYAASGGSPVSDEFLQALRSALIELARASGFPERGGTSDRARFDELGSIHLAQVPEFDSGEALRDDVWAFLATIVLPDLVAWRFADRPAERFHGGVRNAFQRLWIRGRILDRGARVDRRWELLAELTEDALVQITERPSIGSDARLARGFAEAWVRAATRLGRPAMEDVTREAIIRLRLRNKIQLLSETDDSELASAMDSFFTGDIASPQLGRSVALSAGNDSGNG